MEKLLRLQGRRVCMDKEDRLVSIRKKKFFIKGLSNELESRVQEDFLINIIGKSWVPLKVGVFAWRLLRTKCNPRSHLRGEVFRWIIDAFFILRRRD